MVLLDRNSATLTDRNLVRSWALILTLSLALGVLGPLANDGPPPFDEALLLQNP
jgi:hypothetical protein